MKHSRSPHTQTLGDSLFISEIGFEEAVFAYLVKKKEKSLGTFITYLNSCFTSKTTNSLQVFKDLLKKCQSESVIRIGEKYYGDGKIDIRDIHHYSAAIALEAEELISEDSDFLIFEENQNLIPSYVQKKPDVVIVP